MDPIQRALADLRAITTKNEPDPAPEPTGPSCCNGKRTGYQWHQRTQTLPACEESRAAAAAYMAEYYSRTAYKRHVGGKRAG
ncbi:hypothetical protein [Streptomyces sp. NPDC088736]|uniref:hypothetical protein n=1 Tax=Streptomyces sp. NPDC088736 TaxID=3365881 RepID=UPI00382C92DB